MLVLNGLSDAEIDAIRRQPLKEKVQIFDPAEERFRVWRRRNWFIIERNGVGLCVVVDVRTHARAFGETLKEAVNQHYGPVGRDGRDFLYLSL